MKRIVLFASGGGSNVRNIVEYFKVTDVEISLIVSNKVNSGSIHIAEFNNIDHFILGDWSQLIDILIPISPDLIVLAGFLLKVPINFINKFNSKIINIHPSLLPKFGGKGMYGMRVHNAVIEAGEDESGITIHFVNEFYDQGKTIFQKRIKLSEGMTATQLANEVQKLEHEYLPKTIDFLLERKAII